MAKKQPVGMPKYVPSDEERSWYEFCVNNNIIISPVAAEQGTNPKEWRIGISINDHKKVNKTPTIYTEDNIWKEYYLMCKYYYDKYRK